MAEEVEKRFAEISTDTRFARKSKNPIDRRLDFCAYFLSLIQVLEKRGCSFEEIRNICLEITFDFVSPKNKIQSWAKRIPAKLVGLSISEALLKWLNRRTSRLGHPDGFRAEIITNKSETFNLGYGVDILECGICKLFNKYQAGKYANILCEVDKLTSQLAGLELLRSGTIANGAIKCDFRFKKL